MPERKSSSAGARASTASKSKSSAGGSRKQSSSAGHRGPAVDRASARKDADAQRLGGVAEQLINRVLKPLGVVLLTREKIHETLDEAAERGRVTRSDANELAAELIKRGRQQTDDLLSDVEKLFGRGRQQLGSATKLARDPVARLVRGSDRARSSDAAAVALPIRGYDEMTAGQVEGCLDGLSPAELRTIRGYERRHANRKTVLAAIERSLG